MRPDFSAQKISQLSAAKLAYLIVETADNGVTQN
jgi:hypothetical protein